MVRHWGAALAIGSVALGGCGSTIFANRSMRIRAACRSMRASARSSRSSGRRRRRATRVVCADAARTPWRRWPPSAAASAGVSGLPQLPGSAEVASSFTSAEQAALIGARDSTIQLLRDGLYRACEAYMNGALGDFGYGLVLVNYGQGHGVLVSRRRPRPSVDDAAAWVLGSMTGNLTTSVRAGERARERPRTRRSAEPTNGRHRRHDPGDGDACIEPGLSRGRSAATSPCKFSRRSSSRLPIRRMTLRASFLEVAVACLLWLDETGLKKTKTGSDALKGFCDEIARRTPDLAEPALHAQDSPAVRNHDARGDGRRWRTASRKWRVAEAVDQAWRSRGRGACLDGLRVAGTVLHRLLGGARRRDRSRNHAVGESDLFELARVSGSGVVQGFWTQPLEITPELSHGLL